jgi:hypothetical protein
MIDLYLLTLKMVGYHPIERIEGKKTIFLWDNFDLRWDKRRGAGKIRLVMI